jgi:3'-phosphoadenosine 5'-phosphosulfate sulfotransferase (PAPS reductase)/FAD synthetase
MKAPKDPQGAFGLDFEAVNPPTIDDNTWFHVGVSGGKDSSAALLWLVRESGIRTDRILASFCNIANDHEWTINHVKLLSETVHPIETIYPNRKDLNQDPGRLTFFDLAFHKQRFPSTCARFCTEFLKIYPTADHILRLKYEGKNVIAVSGVRADESDDRKNLPEWDYNGNLFCHQWRPLIRWTLPDVYAIHERHNVPLNPLYALGAQRVGCWPCIMSRKAEIRTIALKFPERIDEIRRAEQEFVKRYGRYSSFFPPNICPPRFRSMPHTTEDGRKVMIATIDDVVRWSMTGDGAEGSYLDNPEKETKGCNSGFCE